MIPDEKPVQTKEELTAKIAMLQNTVSGIIPHADEASRACIEHWLAGDDDVEDNQGGRYLHIAADKLREAAMWTALALEEMNR